MTCHVLHAGDGYTYLTQQVASADVTRAAGDPLVAYYEVAGNPPGRWVGSGCADLGMAGEVTEEHMLALFGEGLRPDANEFIAARMAEGVDYERALAGARLGRRFYQFDNTVPLAEDAREAYEAFEKAHERRASVEERREIKVRLARARMVRENPTAPPPSASAVRAYVADQLSAARFPVAGFDLVFSPIKSASLLWALGGPRVRAVVKRVHDAAWRGALAYGEREAAFTRVGTNGVAFVSTSGFVATAFEHRDSRAGDPDLHTHVVVSNRVRAEDGKWRTLDSRQVHKVAVSMSERYNSLLEQGLVDELGVEFVEREMGLGKRPVREIAGIRNEWIRGFSRRRTQVEAHYDDLVRDYVRQHGKTPTRTVQHRLSQQATLTNRPAKTELRTLAEQVADWTDRARELTPDLDIQAAVQAIIDAALTRTAESPLVPASSVARGVGAGSGSVAGEWQDPDLGVEHQIAGTTHRADALAVINLPADQLHALAGQVIERVSEDRAGWTIYHVRAEAERQLRPLPFADAAARIECVEEVTRLALEELSVQLEVELDPPPRLLRRRDGESVFRRRGSAVHTSEDLLAAERRLVEDGQARRGPVVADQDRELALKMWEPTQRHGLNPGQRGLVENFVSSGAALAVAIGPPGTGKTSAMAAVRAVWQTTGGRVIGLAPSAAAASVLGTELGVRADTIHRLVTRYRAGLSTGVRAGDMLLVDEAGMAGTRMLDEVRALAAEQDAVVRLVGDYRQLPAVEAGGALRHLFAEVGGVELSEVHRFADPAEADAVLKLRVGDEAAIPFYVDQKRLHGGVRAVVIDELYRAWKTDIEAGRASIMISDLNDVARELSARAQNDRRAAGLAEDDGVELHDGTTAGVGDRVVTRLNVRHLVVTRTQTSRPKGTMTGRSSAGDGGPQYVKNGDLWQVTDRHPDGSLFVAHVRHGGTVLLPAWYVSQFVELGDAATVHRSQGMTVDTVHAFLSPGAAREAALVALSRGVDANHAYLDTQPILEAEEPGTLPGDLYYRYRETHPAAAALAAIISRESAELSATQQLRAALDAPHRLSTVVPRYLYGLHVHRGTRADEQAQQWVRTALPDLAEEIIADDAWPELVRVLHDTLDTTTGLALGPAAGAGADAGPVGLLRDVAAQRCFGGGKDPARSVARVLHHRITRDLPPAPADPNRPGLLPGWVPTPPEPAGTVYWQDGRDPREVAELDSWLRITAIQIAARVHLLGSNLHDQHADDSPSWAPHLGPVPVDQPGREQWIRNAGQVAAFRERWQIPDTTTDLLPAQPEGPRQRGRDWVQTYLDHHPPAVAAQRAADAQAAADREAARLRAEWRQHAADKAAKARERAHRQQERQRRREDAATVLRTAWRHEPRLANLIATAPAFDTVAARLHEANEAGFGPYDVLTEIPLDHLRASHVGNPAAYLATLIDIAIDRIRTGQADRDAHTRAERHRLDQIRDQAADLLREHWHRRLDLAEVVITSPAYPAFVRALDQHTDAGLDPEALLTSMWLTKLDNPRIHNPGAFAVYLLQLTADHHLRDQQEADRAAQEHAEWLDQQRGAAAVLRQAWAAHPHAAERVITGPAFRILAARMTAAQQASHDTETILRGLNPVALTAPDHANPSASVTYAFTRALTPRDRDPAVASPAPAPADVHEPAPARGAVREGVHEPWTRRLHGRLTDAQLHEQIDRLEHDIAALARDRDQAVHEADQLRAAAEAGTGRRVRAVDDRLHELRAQLGIARDIQDLDTRWQAAINTAVSAAGERARAEFERDHPTGRNRARRSHLTLLINDLRTTEHHASNEAHEVATRAGELAKTRTIPLDLPALNTAVHDAETHHPTARATAQRDDRDTADRARQRAWQLDARHQHATTRLASLHEEQQLRHTLTPVQRTHEEHERTHQPRRPHELVQESVHEIGDTGPEPPEAQRMPDFATVPINAPEVDQLEQQLPEVSGQEPER